MGKTVVVAQDTLADGTALAFAAAELCAAGDALVLLHPAAVNAGAATVMHGAPHTVATFNADGDQQQLYGRVVNKVRTRPRARGAARHAGHAQHALPGRRWARAAAPAAPAAAPSLPPTPCRRPAQVKDLHAAAIAESEARGVPVVVKVGRPAARLGRPCPPRAAPQHASAASARRRQRPCSRRGALQLLRATRAGHKISAVVPPPRRQHRHVPPPPAPASCPLHPPRARCPGRRRRCWMWTPRRVTRLTRSTRQRARTTPPSSSSSAARAAACAGSRYAAAERACSPQQRARARPVSTSAAAAVQRSATRQAPLAHALARPSARLSPFHPSPAGAHAAGRRRRRAAQERLWLLPHRPRPPGKGRHAGR